jgi:hypothetical protein
VSLRLEGDKEHLKAVIKRLRLVFVLTEQKTTGRAGIKHFRAVLGDPSRDIPPVKAKYIYPGKIVAESLSSTDMNVRRNLLGNPMYTGVASFPRFVSNAGWVRGAAYLMREDGIEQFLVNMLYLMRRSIRDFVSE